MQSRTRLRSVALVVAMAGLLAASLVRCSLPELPPPPQALPTSERLPRGAVLSLPGRAIDRAALVASLKELKLTTVILRSSADSSGELVNDRVALAVELQRQLDADVFIGTYQSDGLSGKPMEALLEKNPALSACYPSGGPRLDANSSILDKLRLCSQDVSTKIAEALRVANASPRIGCFITHGPELAESLTTEGRTQLEAFFRDAAGPCTKAARLVVVSPLLSARSGDPARAGVLLRESLQDSGVNVVMLQDGVGTLDPSQPRRAAGYYRGLRNALADRPPPVAVWASVEAFDCEQPSCIRTHPTTAKRFTEQLCGARARVDGIVALEYLHHLAGLPLLPSTQDASVDEQSIADDTDAAAQLRRGYLEWTEAGARCP